VIAEVEHGGADAGVVPIENSIEGSVTVTLDQLAFESDLLIQREIDLPIRLNLCARPGVAINDVVRVLSHPHAHAQCRDWMRSKLPNARIETVSSTAEAARLTARSRRGDQAAVGTAFAAELYRLEILAAGIEDHPDNMTRFVLVGPGVPAPTGHDKTSIVCFQRHDRPGSLLATCRSRGPGDQPEQAGWRPTKRSSGLLLPHRLRGPRGRRGGRDCLRRGRARGGVKFRVLPGGREEEARARRRAASPPGARPQLGRRPPRAGPGARRGARRGGPAPAPP